jgi:hypothetical protein
MILSSHDLEKKMPHQSKLLNNVVQERKEAISERQTNYLRIARQQQALKQHALTFVIKESRLRKND